MRPVRQRDHSQPVPFPASAKVEIVPAFSIQWVERGEYPEVYYGAGQYQYQFGTTVRLKW